MTPIRFISRAIHSGVWKERESLVARFNTKAESPVALPYFFSFVIRVSACLAATTFLPAASGLHRLAFSC